MRGNAILAAAGLVGLVACQALDLVNFVPSCAHTCLKDAISSATKCTGTADGTCVCDRPNFEAIYNSGQSCVLLACTADVAIAQVLPGTYKYCEDVLAAASGTVGTPSTQTTATAGSSTGSSTSSGTTVPTTSPPSSTGTSAGGQGVTSTTTSSSSTAGGAVATAGGVGMLAAIGMGALAML